MRRTWTIIGVADVPRSFKWYQSLLGLPETAPAHDYFGQILDSDGTVLLCLHAWGAHEHPPLMSPDPARPGNGLLLFFRVDDLDMALPRARALVTRLAEEPHVNPNTGTSEFSLRDPDGYYVTISALEADTALHLGQVRLMNRNQALLRHFLAAIAYRTAKALRDAPAGFEAFDAGHQSRAPRELVRHMSGVINYAIGTLDEPRGVLGDRPTYRAEVERFFALLREMADRILAEAGIADADAERLLQGPLSDAMSHAGQLALLRRLNGSPVAPENFYEAEILPSRLGLDQAAPSSPDPDWPEAPDDWTPPGS